MLSVNEPRLGPRASDVVVDSSFLYCKSSDFGEIGLLLVHNTGIGAFLHTCLDISVIGGCTRAQRINFHTASGSTSLALV